MTIDLFAGIPVRDYAAAAAWYERLLGAPPSFLPNDIEAVWEVAEHRYVYIVVRPEHAGHAIHSIFVSDFDTRISQIVDRGLGPDESETYANGVRKATFRDPDGNEIGFGGGPT
jgi:catechol 2,3-dioxygenase-like lactoylglutathione lyase family enzyme